MWNSRLWVLSLVTLLLAESYHASRLPENDDISVQTSVFLSPPFFLQPGSVVDEFLFNIPFPRGHIALKSFDAEVVDENGVPVPLHETYIHHWVINRYFAEISAGEDTRSNIILAGNSGTCSGRNALPQYFGLGSETRRTLTWVPDPYGIEVGDPKSAPDGYKEKWLLNIHAIDTREVKDRMGCFECKCSLYNVTKDGYGRPLPKDYIGGLRCCYDKTQCQLRGGFNGGEVRKLFLRYTMKWAKWNENIVPVKIYIFDVTDTGKIEEGYTSSCKVEYLVNACRPQDVLNGECVDNLKTRVALPHGGDIVYGVAHQHTGGLGAAIYGQDGRVLCSSIPIYGTGEEAGNEEGYIVGMSTCYPKPGSVRIADGELVTVVSNYSSARMHIGVMGLFYILVAEPQTQPELNKLFQNLNLPWSVEIPNYWWAFVLLGGIAAVLVISISYSRRNSEGYKSLQPVDY